MKTIKRIIAASLTALVAMSTTSCYIRISKDAKEELKDKLRFGEEMGKIVYDESDSLVINPGNFNSLFNSCGIDITYVLSDCEPKVVITGKYKSRDQILVENNYGDLNITYESDLGILITHGEKVTVYAPGIEKLDNSGSGDIFVKGNFEANTLEILNRGSGDIDFEKVLLSGPLSITNQGSGDIDLQRCQIDGSVTVSNKGSGDISLNGNARETTIMNSGSGDIDISRLETTSINVTSKGSGDVKQR
ncbi:MAG: DUF2807 domain-containing protein [Bacteroidales bacterium]|nr:DUF2807 domain-containing protein [Bacteroidales bacterium]